MSTNSLWTPPDPDAWKPEKSAADSSPESERRLDELVKQFDAWDADFKARKAALKAAGRDFNRFLKEHAAWSWSHDGLEFTLCRHDKTRRWCGYVRFPTRPVKEPGFHGILAYVPVHGGISWAEDSPDGSFVYGFDCSHSRDAVRLTHEQLKRAFKKAIRTREERHLLPTKRRTRKWLTAQCEMLAAGVRVAARFEDAYLATEDVEKRAVVIDQFRAYLRTEALGHVEEGEENFLVMLNLLSGKL